MSKRTLSFVVSFAAFSAVLLFSSCNSPDGGASSEAATAPNPTSTSGSGYLSRYDYDMSEVSCNPLGGDDPVYYNLGLAAKLYYLSSTMPRYSDAKDYIDNGIEADYNLFFSDLYVPTRYFTSGFPSETGALLEDNSGNDLIEYFGIRFTSNLRLAPGQEAGQYQVALLSDDGSVLSIDQNDGNGLQTFLSNDGTHPSLLGCATQVLNMSASSLYPMQLDYFQGPRYNIALIMLWREIPATVDPTTDPSALSDVACGVEGNNTWFNYNVTPTVALDPFIDLLNRGWQILGPNNFVLPETNPESPCCQGCGYGA